MPPSTRWGERLFYGDRLNQARIIVLDVADPRVHRPAQPLPLMGSGSLSRLWSGPAPCSNMIIFPITRSVRIIRGRLPGLVGDRKKPTAANSKKPEPEADNRAGDRHRGRGKPQRGADHHNGRAGQSGDGVKIGAQHGGDLGQ